jgi:taurine dioxygenase
MKVSPVTGALGAVVEGIDLRNAGGNELGALKAALDKHLVLYVADQSLDRHQLSKLGHFFGPPFLHPIVDNGFKDCPEVLELLREPDQTTLFGGESWHADVSWQDPSGYVSILHGIEIPPVGGDTAFASTQAAFADLSDGLKEMLRGLGAMHSYYWYERREDPEHTVTHPVVRRHPITGREGLYVNRMFTNRFKNMTIAESSPLLNYLFAQMERHEFSCRFRWQPGGVLLWDNRFTLHYPINDFTGERRRMIRTTCLEGTMSA